MTLPATTITISAATLAAALLAAPLLVGTSEPASASPQRRIASDMIEGYVPPPRRAYQPRRRNPYAEQRDDRCRTMPRAC